jgi:hypothetical protein
VIESNKVKFASLCAVFVILFLAGMTAAQTPTCSNRYMLISTDVLTPGPLLTPGMHKIWVGKKVPPKGTIANWRSFGPFQVDAGTKYLLIMTNGKVTGLLANDVTLNSYGNPQNMAGIYYQNKTTDGAWYAVCTQLMKR